MIGSRSVMAAGTALGRPGPAARPVLDTRSAPGYQRVVHGPGRHAGRYDEYGNTGPGSGTGSGRPQLTASQAASYTPQTYLAGTDGWNPLS